MKLRDARQAYDYYTGKLSDVTRQLCFAGVAVVWVFVVKESGSFSLASNLKISLGFFVTALALDLLHYLSSSVTWGIFHRYKEMCKTGEDAEFLAPLWINFVPLIFFWSKVFFALFGYISLYDVFEGIGS